MDRHTEIPPVVVDERLGLMDMYIVNILMGRQVY